MTLKNRDGDNGSVDFPEVDLDVVNAALTKEEQSGQPKPKRIESPALVTSSFEDKLDVAREKMRLRDVGFTDLCKAGFNFTTKWFAITVVVVILTAILAVYITWKEGRFYSSFAMDEKTCSIRLGEDWVIMGRRYYSYNYHDFNNMRFVDRDNIEERNELFVDSTELTIVGFVKDGKTWTYHHPKGEPGVIPLDYADSYAIFSGSVVGTSTYVGFCRGSQKHNPFTGE